MAIIRRLREVDNMRIWDTVHILWYIYHVEERFLAAWGNNSEIFRTLGIEDKEEFVSECIWRRCAWGNFPETYSFEQLKEVVKQLFREWIRKFWWEVFYTRDDFLNPEAPPINIQAWDVILFWLRKLKFNWAMALEEVSFLDIDKMFWNVNKGQFMQWINGEIRVNSQWDSTMVFLTIDDMTNFIVKMYREVYILW